MTRQRPLMLGLLALVILLIVGFGVAWWYTMRRAAPQISGTVRLAGLQAEVEVRRDEWGVPHIYAQNEYDLYFAQGYIHAQDRLWQMDFQRRTGQGRLSEVLGEGALETDRFLRTIGTNRAALADLANLSRESRAFLDAYTAGVNAFINTHQNALPMEFDLLDYAPEPWRPEDSLAWTKMMQWDLGGNWRQEILGAKLARQLGEGRAAQLMAGYPEAGPFIVPAGMQGYQEFGNPDLGAIEAALSLANVGLGASEMGLGSNSWVVAPEKSETGRPILANDPHLGIRIPGIWYLIGLHTPDMNVVGASLPGNPHVIIGHNDWIAWGLTNTGADVQDLFIERLNPQNPNEYEVDGRFEPFRIIRETIQVKGRAQPEYVDVRVSRHGPLLNDVEPGLEQPTAFHWLATAQPSSLTEAAHQLNRARDWESFTKALSLWDMPMQSFVYADVQGNIGYYAAGRVPIRASGSGLLPAPGWDSSHDWVSVIPFDQLPHAFNPPEGFIATANGQPISANNYPFMIGSDWAAPNRHQRIVTLLTAQDTFTLDDMQQMQGDVVSVAAQTLVPLLLDIHSEDVIVQRAQDQLREWQQEGQSRMDPELPGAAIYEVTYRQLVRHLVSDELHNPELLQDDDPTNDEMLLNEYLRQNHRHQTLVLQLINQLSNPWWDDVSTPDVHETRTEILRRALESMALELGRQFGDVPHEWDWGRVHEATFGHPLAQGSSQAASIFNRSAGGVPGSGHTIFATNYRTTDRGFPVTAIPGYRQVLDVGEWDNSRFLQSTGQSGHPFSDHYDDMIPLWEQLELTQMRFSPEVINEAAVATLRLQPIPTND